MGSFYRFLWGSLGFCSLFWGWSQAIESCYLPGTLVGSDVRARERADSLRLISSSLAGIAVAFGRKEISRHWIFVILTCLRFISGTGWGIDPHRQVIFCF